MRASILVLASILGCALAAREARGEAWSADRIAAVNALSIGTYRSDGGPAVSILVDGRGYSILNLSLGRRTTDDPTGLKARLAKIDPKDAAPVRTAGQRMEIRYGDGFVPFSIVRKQPRGTRIEKSESKLAMGSTAGYSMGGSRSTELRRDGRFEIATSAGASTSTGRDSSVGARARSHAQGTYEIEGYVMTLRYDDGRVEHRLVLLDDRGAVIYLGD